MSAIEWDSVNLGRVDRGETLTQRATRLVREAIVSGKLPAGAQLTIPAIAKTCGVSATPAREALIHLSEAGLVRMGAGRITIAAPSEPALRQAFELREALEGMAARLAADRCDADGLAGIREHAELSVARAAARDRQAFREHDALFHRGVMAAAHSPELERYGLNAMDLALTLRNLRRPTDQSRASSAHRHVEVAQAIADRDPDAAERLMRLHVREVLAGLLDTGAGEAP